MEVFPPTALHTLSPPNIRVLLHDSSNQTPTTLPSSFSKLDPKLEEYPPYIHVPFLTLGEQPFSPCSFPGLLSIAGSTSSSCIYLCLFCTIPALSALNVLHHLHHFRFPLRYLALHCYRLPLQLQFLEVKYSCNDVSSLLYTKWNESGVLFFSFDIWFDLDLPYFICFGLLDIEYLFICTIVSLAFWPQSGCAVLHLIFCFLSDCNESDLSELWDELSVCVSAMIHFGRWVFCEYCRLF